MAYFNLEMELTNGNIHWPDVAEIAQLLRDVADYIETSNSASIQALGPKGEIQAYCDVTDQLTGVLKQRRDLVAQDKAIRSAFNMQPSQL